MSKAAIRFSSFSMFSFQDKCVDNLAVVILEVFKKENNHKNISEYTVFSFVFLQFNLDYGSQFKVNKSE